MDNVFAHKGGRIQDTDNPNATTPNEPPGWYFWDETEAYYHGPFGTKEEADASLEHYCKEAL